MIRNERCAIKVTHIPSGETVISDSKRSQHENRNIAMKVSRSRLWAQQNGFPRPSMDDIVANYELPDEPPYPDDLEDIRTFIGHK